MNSEPRDLDAILAEHQPRRPTFLITEEWWCPECDIYFTGNEGCLPYRLAAELTRLRAAEQRVRALCEAVIDHQGDTGFPPVVSAHGVLSALDGGQP